MFISFLKTSIKVLSSGSPINLPSLYTFTLVFPLLTFLVVEVSPFLRAFSSASVSATSSITSRSTSSKIYSNAFSHSDSVCSSSSLESKRSCNSFFSLGSVISLSCSFKLPISESMSPASSFKLSGRVSTRSAVSDELSKPAIAPISPAS